MSKKDKVTRDQAESAVRTLIQWAGDDPDREGLIETPKEWLMRTMSFSLDMILKPKDFLSKVLEEVEAMMRWSL